MTQGVDFFQILENIMLETLGASTLDLTRVQLHKYVLALENYLELAPPTKSSNRDEQAHLNRRVKFEKMAKQEKWVAKLKEKVLSMDWWDRRLLVAREQLENLKPFVGAIGDSCTSFFMGTWYMYFPFLTCEVKRSAAALDIADRQNAHSMTIAVRTIVELFRYVKREKELDQEILAFSISHDHRTARIYGHYTLIDGNNTTFYRHPIHMFDFTALDGKEKWTAFKFVRNAYNV